MIGDLIAEEITGHGIRHWMLVTQGSPQLALSYHSTDYLNTPFQDVQTRVGTQGSLSYWKIFDFYSDADEPFYYSSLQDTYQKAMSDFVLQKESPPPRS